MKRTMSIVLVAVLSLLTVSTVFAQDPTKVLVDKDLLTPEQLAKVKAGQTMDQVIQVGQFAGVGKEIGEAVNSSLSALTDNADKFANTKVGTWTMWIVTYKVIGNKVIRMTVSFVMLAVLIPIFVWALQRNGLKRRVLARESYNVQTKIRTKEYEVIEPTSYQMAAYSLIPLLAVLVLIILAAA